jgi:hypothetical protein
MLQGFVFNEPIWFQFVDVDKHWVKIKLINGDKLNGIIRQTILYPIWSKPSSLKIGKMFKNSPWKP